MPPAASIASRAPLVTLRPLTVTARETSPDLTTLTNWMFFLTRPAACNAFTSTTSPSTLAISKRLTSVDTNDLREVKPNLVDDVA